MAGVEAGAAAVEEEASARRPVAGCGMKKFEWEGWWPGRLAEVGRKEVRVSDFF
jgi:hypothetical protein